MVIFVLLVAAIATSPSLAEQFRKNYQYIAEQNAFYKAHRQLFSWYDAYKYCKGEGASLFFPNSAEEITLVTNMLPESFWVGASNLLSSKVLIDMEGNDILEFEHTHWEERTLNLERNKHCVVMTQRGRIYVWTCENLMPFICKRLAQNTTQNSACRTWDEGYILNKDFNSCYKFHTSLATWTDAFLTCHNELSHLVIIDSKEEADFIVKRAKPIKGGERGVHNANLTSVGFHARFEKDNYVTVDGQSLDRVYNVWEEGHPHSRGAGIHECGAISTKSLLRTSDCMTMRMRFVCERDLRD